MWWAAFWDTCGYFGLQEVAAIFIMGVIMFVILDDEGED